MRRSVRLLLPLLLLLAASPVFAQGIRVTADRVEATVEDQIQLQVAVEGGGGAQPQFPDLSAFQVYNRGTSRQMSIVNGRSSSSVIYNILLVPKASGTFDIGPASVDIDGETYQSQPFKIRVLDADAQPGKVRDVFIEASVLDPEPFVGEQVIYVWRYYRHVRVGVAGAQILGQNTFDGFLVEDLGDPQNPKRFNRLINGQEYEITEVRKALFPQEEGELTIEPWQLEAQVMSNQRRRRGIFDDFFSSRSAQTKILSARPVQLKVRPLPSPPADFSGLVGQYSVTSRVLETDLQVGESTTWTTTISGTGNIKTIPQPKFPQIDQIKFYDDQPKTKITSREQALKGTKTFAKALVPLAAGEISIPSIPLVYFEPDSESYRTAESSPIPLMITPGEGREDLNLTESIAPSTGKVAVKILADDILPIVKRLDAVAPAPFGQRLDAFWWAGVSAPPLLYFGLLFFHRRRRHLSENVHLVRRRSALGKARKNLDAARKAHESGDEAEAVRLASFALREYVGDKAALSGGAFTAQEATEELRRQEVEESLVERTHRSLERFEAAQYGGGIADVGAVIDELGELLAQLESQIKRGGKR